MLSLRTKWPYRLQQIGEVAWLFPLNFWGRATERSGAKLWHQGILINDAIYNDEQRERTVFIYRLLADALRFMKQHDEHRFRRVQREARVILITQLPDANGEYKRFERKICVNFASFQAAEECGVGGEHYEWYVALCASLLVHEATHGALCSRYVPYNKATRIRAERLCRREQERFAARLPRTRYEYATALVRPFDPAEWEPSWNKGYRQRVTFAIAMIRDIREGKEIMTPGSATAKQAERERKTKEAQPTRE